MSRIHYAVKTVASAAHLLSSCRDPNQIDTIMARMTEMLNMVWEVEHRAITSSTAPENRPAAIKEFWDVVSFDLVCTGEKRCHSFTAIHGEEVNPPLDSNGNVHISFQATNSTSFFVAKLKLPPAPAEIPHA